MCTPSHKRVRSKQVMQPHAATCRKHQRSVAPVHCQAGYLTQQHSRRHCRRTSPGTPERVVASSLSSFRPPCTTLPRRSRNACQLPAEQVQRAHCGSHVCSMQDCGHKCIPADTIQTCLGWKTLKPRVSTMACGPPLCTPYHNIFCLPQKRLNRWACSVLRSWSAGPTYCHYAQTHTSVAVLRTFT